LSAAKPKHEDKLSLALMSRNYADLLAEQIKEFDIRENSTWGSQSILVMSRNKSEIPTREFASTLIIRV
jgi:hypothetical protein